MATNNVIRTALDQMYYWRNRRNQEAQEAQRKAQELFIPSHEMAQHNETAIKLRAEAEGLQLAINLLSNQMETPDGLQLQLLLRVMAGDVTMADLREPETY